MPSTSTRHTHAHTHTHTWMMLCTHVRTHQMWPVAAPASHAEPRGCSCACLHCPQRQAAAARKVGRLLRCQQAEQQLWAGQGLLVACKGPAQGPGRARQHRSQELCPHSPHPLAQAHSCVCVQPGCCCRRPGVQKLGGARGQGEWWGGRAPDWQGVECWRGRRVRQQ